MIMRISSAVLSLAALFALISGILFWAGFALNLMSLHMLVGFLAVIALWTIGIAQLFSSRGSWTIAACTLIVGALTIFVGLYQSVLLPGQLHWIIQTVHVILGILTVGLGHMAAARYRRRSA